MSPPEVWGPPIWTLFHTLIEKLNEKYYYVIYQQLFNIIKQICRYLPCPECSNDATIFLSKIKIQNLSKKTNFQNTMYLFHNYVNKKKNKPMFNFSNMYIYKNKNLLYVIKNFMEVYNTKGNMKLLTETFQRQMVMNNFRKWILNNFAFFYEAPQSNTVNKKEESNQKSENIKELSKVSDIKQNVITPVISSVDNNNLINIPDEPFCGSDNNIIQKDNEESAVEEEAVVEDSAVKEEAVVEDSAVEERVEEETIVEESVVKESIEKERVEEKVEEEALVEENIIDENEINENIIED